MFETFWKKEKRDDEPVGEEFANLAREAYNQVLSNKEDNHLET